MRVRRAALAILALPLAAPASAQGQGDPRCNPAVLASHLARLPAGERPYVEAEVTERCAHAHLPDKPAHDTADADPDASHTHWTYAAKFVADGKLVASAGFDRTVKLWDAASGRLVRTLLRLENPQPERNPSYGYIRDLALLPDGKRLIVNADGYPLRIVALDADATAKPAEGPAPRGGLLDLLAAPDTSVTFPRGISGVAAGLVFATTAEHTAVLALDVESLQPKYRLALPFRKLISVAASDAAGLVATGLDRAVTSGGELEPRIVLWRIADGQKVAELATGSVPHALAFSGDGKVLAAAVDGGGARVFSVADRKPLPPIQVSRYGVHAVALNRDGSLLVTCASHPRLWDVASGKHLRHFGPFTDGCHSAGFDPQERFIVTTSMGSDLRVWEVGTGAFHRRLGRDVKPPR